MRTVDTSGGDIGVDTSEDLHMGQFCLSQKWPNPGLFNSNFGRSLQLSGLVLMASDSFYLTNTSSRVTLYHIYIFSAR